MPLTTRAPGQSPIDSSAINQFVQALTGVMADQPFTLANTLTVTNTLTASSAVSISSNLTVLGSAVVDGVLESSAFVALGGASFSSRITASSKIFVGAGLPSSAATALLQFGQSSGPSIYFGSSTPTIACTPPSMFFNTGGSSATGLYLCVPNGGGASSSNWNTVAMS